MSGYTITNKKKHFDLSKFLIILSLILILSCIFLPFVAIYTYQNIFISDGIEAWFFTTPNINYYFFAGALIWFSLVIWIFLFYRNNRLLNDKKVSLSPFILLAFPGIFTILLSLNHYFYLNDDGIHVNQFWGVGVESYKWKEVVATEQLQKINNGVMVEGDLVFSFDNGDIFHLPVTKDVQLNKRRIYAALRESNVEVKRVLPEQK
jgi:hypothetical protein